MRRVWSLIVLGDQRQYGGNTGYQDKIESEYRYDSAVANHIQVSKGDLVFIRDRGAVLGMSLIDDIQRWNDRKVRQRCPECNTTSIKRRINADQTWRCSRGHMFMEPATSLDEVTSFTASFGASYLRCEKSLSADRLKKSALRPNDQMSIEEIDLSLIEAEVLDAIPGSEGLLRTYLMQSPNLNNLRDSPFDAGLAVAREAELRAIKVRRGQQRFRNSLVSRYGPACQITGCAVIEIVEAAHIVPYVGLAHHHPQNGLLLRSDIHTLFDLGLIGIEPKGLTIHLHPQIVDRTYASLVGVKLSLGSSLQGPSQVALGERWRTFGA